MKSLILISFLFSVQFLFAQEPEITFTIEPTNAEVGEIITITVRSNIEGTIEIDNLPSSFVHGYDVLNGMEQEMDYSTGEVITYYFFSQTGAIGKKGKYTIGPAYVKRGNKTYISNTVDIIIGEDAVLTSTDVSKKQMSQPAFGIIQTNKKTIYEGEPIVVQAKIYSRFEPTHLEGYQSYELPGTIDKEKIAGGKRIIVERERYKNESFYAFEYDKTVIFPAGIGDFKILPFTMKLNQNFKGYQFKSNATIVHIKPLPDGAPVDFIGGVGKFTLKRNIEEKELTQGDVFKLNITVKGKGNIQNTSEPTLHLPKGFIVYGDPEIEENYSYNSNGAEGEIRYSYNIQVNGSGEKEFPSTSISYFDPILEKYISIASNSDTILVKKDPNYITQIEPEALEIEELSTNSFLRSSEVKYDNDSFYGNSLFWVLTGSPLFLSIFYLFFIRKKEENASEIEAKQFVRKKSKKLNNTIDKLKLELTTGNNDDFFSKLEKTLRGAIEIRLSIKEENQVSRNEMMKQLANEITTDELKNIQSIFEQCDQYRYGFPNTDASKQELFEQTKQTIEKLSN